MKPKGTQFSMPRMQTDQPGRPGFQYPLTVQARHLRDGSMAEFLPQDLHDGGMDDWDRTVTGRSHGTYGTENPPVGTDTRGARGFDTDDTHRFWKTPRAVEETVDDAWERKLDESWDDRLYQEIEAEGVHRPVLIQDSTNPEIKNGHHRVAAAADIDPKMEVPVAYGQFYPGSNYTPKDAGHPDVLEAQRSGRSIGRIQRTNAFEDM